MRHIRGRGMQPRRFQVVNIRIRTYVKLEVSDGPDYARGKREKHRKISNLIPENVFGHLGFQLQILDR